MLLGISRLPVCIEWSSMLVGSSRFPVSTEWSSMLVEISMIANVY